MNSTIVRATLHSMKLEEENAIKSDPVSDADRFLKLSSQIRSMVTSSSVHHEFDQETQIDLAMMLAEMKQLNRLEKLRTQNNRAKVSQLKRKVDTFFLQLQNLRDEEMYIQKEAKRCFDYKSKVDEADLVSLEEFYQSPRFQTIDAEAKQDEHKLTLARLEWELEQRISLAREVDESSTLTLESKRQITCTQDTLSRLRQSMSSVVEALSPLSNELGRGEEEITRETMTRYREDEMYFNQK